MSSAGYFRPLRYLKFWLAIGVALIALDVYLTLTTADFDVDPRIADKRGHVIAYFGLMAYFAGLVRRERFVWVAAALMALGIVLEFVQWWMGVRLPETEDVVANGVGVGLGWLASRLGLAGWCERFERFIAP